MSELAEDMVFFERITAREVQHACEQVMPGRRFDIQPYMFDATVTIRHPPGEAPCIEEADRIAALLREGRPLTGDRADWHVGGFDPYCDAIDPTVVYGTSFGLVRSFLPGAAALERAGG